MLCSKIISHTYITGLPLTSWCTVTLQRCSLQVCAVSDNTARSGTVAPEPSRRWQRLCRWQGRYLHQSRNIRTRYLSDPESFVLLLLASKCAGLGCLSGVYCKLMPESRGHRGLA